MVVGTHLGWGKPGLKDWEEGIDWRARVGRFVRKPENRAAGARLWLKQCGGAWIRVEGTHLGRGKPGLKHWDAEIDRRARVGDFKGKTKTELLGHGFCKRSGGGARTR
jgi:hypothetical protein